ncbi:MAG: nitroreductase [Erysipelotrichaceae bacterium]|nr:nitroreductase [Erysipelotrichaceae bacterium]
MSDILKLMETRHSVRQYLDKTIPADIREELDTYASDLNRTGDLHIQIFYDEPDCFNSRLAHYGRFENCSNYIVMAGKKADDLEERCGYYGELLVLKAQVLGLNTCWAALTHGKSKAVLEENEKEVIVIALGYGKTQGNPRRSKSPSEVSDMTEDSPEWYTDGVKAALLAPTAVNQQKFRFIRNGNKVTARPGKIGSCLKIDLGIVKCHFELGAGKENFDWI